MESFWLLTQQMVQERRASSGPRVREQRRGWQRVDAGGRALRLRAAARARRGAPALHRAAAQASRRAPQPPTACY